jgi:hypothetical protein
MNATAALVPASRLVPESAAGGENDAPVVESVCDGVGESKPGRRRRRLFPRWVALVCWSSPPCAKTNGFDDNLLSRWDAGRGAGNLVCSDKVGETTC